MKRNIWEDAPPKQKDQGKVIAAMTHVGHVEHEEDSRASYAAVDPPSTYEIPPHGVSPPEVVPINAEAHAAITPKMTTTYTVHVPKSDSKVQKPFHVTDPGSREEKVVKKDAPEESKASTYSPKRAAVAPTQQVDSNRLSPLQTETGEDAPEQMETALRVERGAINRESYDDPVTNRVGVPTSPSEDKPSDQGELGLDPPAAPSHTDVYTLLHTQTPGVVVTSPTKTPTISPSP